MQTKEIVTKSGTKVTLTIDPKKVVADLSHPKAGRVNFAVSYGTHNGQSGLIGHWYNNRRYTVVVLTCDEQTWKDILETQKTVREEAESEKARDQAERLAAAKSVCPAGHEIATRLWANGDLCSAQYETQDGVQVLASDLMDHHCGFYFLPAALVEEKRSKDRKAWQELESQTAAEREAEEAAFARAKETGKPVFLRETTAPCDDSSEECSIDIITVFAMPDGSTKTERHHTW